MGKKNFITSSITWFLLEKKKNPWSLGVTKALCQNSKYLLVTKPKKSKCKKIKHSNCDTTQKTQIVTKLKNPNCDQNSKTQIVTKFKNTTCERTQFMTKLFFSFFYLLVRTT